MLTKSRACYTAAVLILLAGLIITIGVFWISDIRMMPSTLADIYREKQNRLSVPGGVDVQLTREGAYGIYYHYSLVTSERDRVELPPEIECSLTSSTGKTSLGVMDYVPSNRYWENDNGGPAVLIQSISIDEPGEFQFSCRYPEGVTGPSFQVSLGPNYVWEMIRVVFQNGLALLLVLFSLPAAILTSIVLFLSGLISGRAYGSTHGQKAVSNIQVLSCRE